MSPEALALSVGVPALGVLVGIIGWLLKRAIDGVDAQLKSMDGKLDKQAETTGAHGQRLASLEEKLGVLWQRAFGRGRK